MTTLYRNELEAYEEGFSDGFKTGQAALSVVWILSDITNNGESLEENTTVHKTLAGVVEEISRNWKKWRSLNYDSDEDTGKKEVSRLSYEEPLTLEEVSAAANKKGVIVLVENKEEFDGVFTVTLQQLQLLS
jgi:hypothetical protein